MLSASLRSWGIFPAAPTISLSALPRRVPTRESPPRAAQSQLLGSDTNICQRTQRAPSELSHGDLPGHHHYLTGPTVFPTMALWRNQKLPRRCPRVPTHPWCQRLQPRCQQLTPGDKPPCSCAMSVLNLGEPLLRCPLSMVSASEVKPMISSWSHWPQRAVLSCKCFPSALWRHLGLQ